MTMLIELKTVSGERLAVNPNGVTALISHDGMTEIYLYGADQYFLVEGDYWTVRDKLNQGKPTIPLSVIEKIKAEITNKADDADKGCKISSDYYIREKLRTIAQTCDEVCKIIDKAVKECEA